MCYTAGLGHIANSIKDNTDSTLVFLDVSNNSLTDMGILKFYSIIGACICIQISQLCIKNPPAHTLFPFSRGVNGAQQFQVSQIDYVRQLHYDSQLRLGVLVHQRAQKWLH